MKNVGPPGWLQGTLRWLLAVRDRETVAGDLQEEFCERKAPELGVFRANLWYARQVLSFAPRRLASVFAQAGALQWLCLFTGMSGAWLGVMGFYLRHANHEGEIIAGIILAQATLTVIALHRRSNMFLKWLAMVGCLPIVWVSVMAILNTLRGAHLEGYVLLIATALLVQAVLTLATMAAASRSTDLKA